MNALTRTNKYANGVVMVEPEWHKQLAELDGLVKSLILLWGDASRAAETINKSFHGCDCIISGIGISGN